MSDGAIATIVTGLITITMTVIGFLTLWLKLRYGVTKAEETAEKVHTVEKKLDANTVMTAAGVNAASTKADAIVEQLNGKLEDRIRSIVKEQLEPIIAMFKIHSDQDDKNTAEIRESIEKLGNRSK